MLPAILAEHIHLIDLSHVSRDDIGLEAGSGHHHSSSLGYGLGRILRQIGVARSDCILDLGCGKAGAIIALSAFPFRRIDGVDISAALVRVAKRNLARLRISRGDLYWSDARDFNQLDCYTHIFMYNPFPDNVMSAVMCSLAESLRQEPRKFTLIYRNPLYHDTVASSGLFDDVLEFNPPGKNHTHVYVHTPEA